MGLKRTTDDNGRRFRCLACLKRRNMVHIGVLCEECYAEGTKPTTRKQDREFRKKLEELDL